MWCNCIGPKMHPLPFPFKSQPQKYCTLSMTASFLCCSSGSSKNLKSPAIFKLEFLNYGPSPWYFWRKWILFSLLLFLWFFIRFFWWMCASEGLPADVLHMYSTSLFLLNYPFLFSCVISYCSAGLSEQQVCCWLAFWGFSCAWYCICLLVLWFVMFCLWLLQKV